MGRKKKIQKCKQYRLKDEEELNYLIDKTKKFKYKVILILLSVGLREGEVSHARLDWLHIDDKKSKLFGADFIEIPSSDIQCDCTDCLLRAYIEKKQNDTDGEPHSLEWYKKIQKRFFKLKRLGKLPKLKHYWSPKTEAGARKVWILNKDHALLVKEYYEKNESIGMQRRRIWTVVKELGEEILGKKLFPHAVRSTSASILADKGCSAVTLMSNMGWNTINTANNYVKPNERMALRDMKDRYKISE